MHILHIANYAPPYGGGIQFVMAELASRSVALGHRVTILAADTGIPTGRSSWRGVERIGVRASNLLERRSIPYPLFDPFALRRALAEVLATIDVVHVHGLLYLDVVAAAWMAARQDKRVILTEHVGHVPYDSHLLNVLQQVAIGTIGRSVVRRADAVVVLNGRVQRAMSRIAQGQTPIVRIPNGVDTTWFRPPTDRAALREHLGLNRSTVLFAGRLAEKKGFPLVLAAARALPHYTFVVCGQDTERLTNPPENMRVVGQIDRAALVEWYGAADALLLPSEGEGFPLVLQEGLACGTPVIVTDDETNREYLDPSVAVFTSRRPDAVSEAVRRLLNESAAPMRTAARAWALAQFDWAHTLDSYLHLYQGAGVGADPMLINSG